LKEDSNVEDSAKKSNSASVFMKVRPVWKWKCYNACVCKKECVLFITLHRIPSAINVVNKFLYYYSLEGRQFSICCGSVMQAKYSIKCLLEMPSLPYIKLVTSNFLSSLSIQVPSNWI